MTEFVVSLVYDADVVRKGRRRESREAFRHDVPVEIREVSRRELTPALRIVHPDANVTLPADAEGRLWRPFLPDERRNHRPPRPIGGAGSMVEARAQTLAEFAEAIAGRRPLCEDPLERRRSALQDEPLAHLRWEAKGEAVAAAHASRLPRIEESDVVAELWSERSAAEARLRAAAEDVLIVDGRIWVRAAEPALALANSGGRRTTVSWTPPAYHPISEFRLDRMDDLLAWALSRQGIAAVPPDKGTDPARIAADVEVEVLRPETLRRDDARELLVARLHPVLYASAKLVAHLPADGVDMHVALKRFLEDPAGCRRATAELYGDLAGLGAAAAGLSGLDEDGFAARDQVRRSVSPLVARWNSCEAGRYAPSGPERESSENVGPRPA